MNKLFKKLISTLALTTLFFTGCAMDSVSVSGSDNLEGMEVHFLNVGQADCSLIKFSDGSNVLIDGGNNGDGNYITEYLQNEDVKKLDVVVGTHPHEDHIGSLDTVIKNFDVGAVYMPDDVATTKTFEDVIDAVDEKGLSITEPVMGDTFNVGGGTFTILGPQKKYNDHNNNSIVLKLSYGDINFMFTGDAEAEAESDILSKGYDVKADVLKVGHHGSSTSTSDEWLNAVSPSYAVIQSETGNDYGHPHKETIDKLDKAGIQIFRNDKMGEIVMNSDGKNITVTTSDGSSYELSKQAAQGTDTNTQNQNTTTANESSESSETTAYIGNINSKKFHRENCSSLPSESNRVYFDSRDNAISEGYEPCGICKP